VQQYRQATQRHQESEIKNNPKDESKTDHTNKSTNGSTGTVVIAHGYLDHSGLYGRLIEWGLQQGYDVLCFDLPGHGLSSGEAACIEQFSTYADILEQLIALHANSSLKKPYIAIGQSTGCAVIANYLLRKHPIFDRAILLAPLIRSAQWRWLRYLYKLLVRITPRIRRKFIASSHDKIFNHFLHHQDPLQARYIPLAWLGAMDSWYLYCQQQTTNTNDKGENRTITVDIIQGTQDATVDWRYNVGELHRLFANTTTHYIQGAKHHLVNEAPRYWQRIKDTLDRISTLNQ